MALHLPLPLANISTPALHSLPKLNPAPPITIIRIISQTVSSPTPLEPSSLRWATTLTGNLGTTPRMINSYSRATSAIPNQAMTTPWLVLTCHDSVGSHLLTATSAPLKTHNLSTV